MAQTMDISNSDLLNQVGAVAGSFGDFLDSTEGKKFAKVMKGMKVMAAAFPLAALVLDVLTPD